MSGTKVPHSRYHYCGIFMHSKSKLVIVLTIKKRPKDDLNLQDAFSLAHMSADNHTRFYICHPYETINAANAPLANSVTATSASPMHGIIKTTKVPTSIFQMADHSSSPIQPLSTAVRKSIIARIQR
ncbi:MAG: hypothetical protein LUI13_10035, partial [Lachnospiraceae bacterium]|nr:hypothetical protein [Lachnospiraceae bacterium]